MATWEDGPEYAPLERPDAFAGPSVASTGLEAPPAPVVPPPAPVERPVFDGPQQAAPPLEALVPAPPDQRDPNRPFDVVSSVMTSDTSAWASAHWASPQAGSPGPYDPVTGPEGSTPLSTYPNGSQPFGSQPYGSSPSQPYGAPSNGADPRTEARGTNGRRPVSPAFPPPTGGLAFPPPTGAPSYPPPGAAPSQSGYGNPAGPSFPEPGPFFPPPGQPFPAPGQPFPPPAQQPANGPFPAPGTPQWFAPGDYQQAPPPPTAPAARDVLAATTPGVLITLVVGGVIWVLAPVTLVLGFVLSSRMAYGRRVTRTVFAAVLAFLGLVGLISLVTADGLFTQWWSTVAAWACFGSWVMVVAAVVAVYRALRRGRPDVPPAPRYPHR